MNIKTTCRVRRAPAIFRDYKNIHGNESVPEDISVKVSATITQKRQLFRVQGTNDEDIHAQKEHKTNMEKQNSELGSSAHTFTNPDTNSDGQDPETGLIHTHYRKAHKSEVTCMGYVHRRYTLVYCISVIFLRDNSIKHICLHTMLVKVVV